MNKVQDIVAVDLNQFGFDGSEKAAADERAAAKKNGGVATGPMGKRARCHAPQKRLTE
jgi:hypothetical protein